MMNKTKIADLFRRSLTRISPMLNTKVTYRVKFGKRLDLNSPKTLNEKILWLKFHDYLNNPLVAQCADKFQVRKYIEKVGCPELLPMLYGVYEKAEDIPWDELPDSFAAKVNVGCGFNLIVGDKKTLDYSEATKRLSSWLREAQSQWLSYSELQYKDVKTCIVVESYLGKPDGSRPEDYKFYCLNGRAKYVMVCVGRGQESHSRYYYFDRDWNMMPFTQDALDSPSCVIDKPEGIDSAFDYAERLSKPFPFVRSDFYIVDGKPYFGELTFTPSAGLDNGRLVSTDELLGEMLDLGFRGDQ